MKKLFIFLFITLFPFSAISAPTNIPDVLITDINNPNWVDVRRFADIEPGLTALANKTATLRITKDVTLDNTYGLGDYSGVTVHIMPGFTCTITNPATYGFNIIVEDQGILAIDSNITIGGNLTVKGDPDTSIVKVTGNEVLTVSGIYNKNVDISHKILHVAGISALRLSVPIKDGEVRYLDYHTTMGDGGDGNVIWDADNVSTDNNGTIIQVTGITTGRWIRQLNGFVTPQMFGVMGNGTDETTQLQVMLDASVGKTIQWGVGTGAYYETDELIVPSNTTIVFSPGVVVKIIDNIPDYTRIFATAGSNIHISGYATLQMNRDTDPPVGESQHGILLTTGCVNVTIKDLTIKDTGGDGIAISGAAGTPRNAGILIENVTIDRAYRNGISLGSGDGVYIRNCRITNTGGTLPGFGIDIEPNSATGDVVKNVWIEDNVISDSVGAAISVNRQVGSNTIDNININRNKTTGNGFGIWLIGRVGGLITGQIKIDSHTSDSDDIAYFSSYTFGVNVTNSSFISSGASGIQDQNGGGNKYIGNTVKLSTTRGIYINGSTDVLLDGNTVEFNKQTGILGGSVTNLMILSNHIKSNCTDSAQTYDANVCLLSGLTCSVHNNIIRAGSETYKPAIGLNIGSSAQGTLFANNDCYTGGETSGIVVQASAPLSQKNGNNINNDGTYSATPN